MCHNAESFDPMRKLMKENAMCFINYFFIVKLFSLLYRVIMLYIRADFKLKSA